MVRVVTMNDIQDIQTRLKDIDNKLLIVNKNQITIENNAEILKKNFLHFKKNVLDSVKEVVKDVDRKRDDVLDRKYERFEKRAMRDLSRQVKEGIQKVKTGEMDKMLDRIFKRIEKRLAVLEQFVDEKVATSKLLSKKFDEEKRSMEGFVKTKIGSEVNRLNTELKQLAKYDKDQQRFIKMIDSVKDDVNAVARERQTQQRLVMDLVNTIEELRERMDMTEKDNTMNSKLMENKMVQRIDDDISAMIGDMQDIKDRIQKLEVQGKRFG